ncbi:NAD(P)/FAD-dependent oxidoreductase [Atopobium sp. oral taxon 199]|uniref:NAD(P)/FAD-dependent oxidoreductase n=1 Tax=Atopobium sp. oral taxon 199 TaxID=712156 RepID=UPI00034ECD18|nr:NAD(P)/FAD-dependent oxidoreductase [Atopobium sp. oral taxon 199]EPD78227.1 hypothetical protein HMPREF1527_00545 [Atopobium sp. oral taxon 199 str. F0494]
MATQRKKRLSRTEKNDALLEQAAAVALPSVADVVVVGGGASGLTAAITAAETLQDTGSPGTVIVFEQALTCGRTILATGGGRCNFANTDLRPEYYRHPNFVRSVTDGTYLKDILSFFRECGLAWVTEEEGRLYPVTRQAASVRSVLLARTRKAKVICACARRIIDIQKDSEKLSIIWEDLFGAQKHHTLVARTVILAGGGASASTFARKLGLATVPERPGLCALTCLPEIPVQLDGKRAHARALLTRDGHLEASETGEILFRRFGVSGIMVFNMSRSALPGDTFTLDLLSEVDHDSLQAAITAQTIDGVLDPDLAEFAAPQSSVPAKIAAAQALTLTVTGVAPSVPAQVTLGGLSVKDFDRHLEACSCPGLFACGETLDIDAPCGGFNLAWAWKSGMVAGTSAARRLL